MAEFTAATMREIAGLYLENTFPGHIDAVETAILESAQRGGYSTRVEDIPENIVPYVLDYLSERDFTARTVGTRESNTILVYWN